MTLVFALLPTNVTSACDLTFDRTAHRLVLKDKDGKEVGGWEAYNNVVKSAKLFPGGTWKFSHHASHAADSDGPYGSFGNLVFNVPQRTEMGVHAGRVHAKNNPGPQHPTEGCIRTTDDAMKAITELHKKDPVKTLTVRE